MQNNSQALYMQNNSQALHVQNNSQACHLPSYYYTQVIVQIMQQLGEPDAAMANALIDTLVHCMLPAAQTDNPTCYKYDAGPLSLPSHHDKTWGCMLLTTHN